MRTQGYEVNVENSLPLNTDDEEIILCTRAKKKALIYSAYF